MINFSITKFVSQFCGYPMTSSARNDELEVENKEATIKEGYLLKQTSSFQRWGRRFFKLKGRSLYYAKDSKVANSNASVIHSLPSAHVNETNVL
ncbi:hypothetical protein WA026_022110, partial [Henosepilachna vigintioctopunctata]